MACAVHPRTSQLDIFTGPRARLCAMALNRFYRNPLVSEGDRTKPARCGSSRTPVSLLARAITPSLRTIRPRHDRFGNLLGMVRIWQIDRETTGWAAGSFFTELLQQKQGIWEGIWKQPVSALSINLAYPGRPRHTLGSFEQFGAYVGIGDCHWASAMNFPVVSNFPSISPVTSVFWSPAIAFAGQKKNQRALGQAEKSNSFGAEKKFTVAKVHLGESNLVSPAIYDIECSIPARVPYTTLSLQYQSQSISRAGKKRSHVKPNHGNMQNTESNQDTAGDFTSTFMFNAPSFG
ncbi:hypothetical protein B0H17DRAFT_1133935 [Mycena rosella]|uniref:Uncharacterized protein n=1 Tax=Mycena rosella TaxID=1033263 RepID=A0AAD7DHS1_MYCRO|nr:hypothetical protein B0H17DRAFT_1133935 [Mycena rosella]